MRRVQDEFFDRRYFRPAVQWADTNGFALPFSGLVIYDSFIHSGGILDVLRKRFPEVPPARGGSEKAWITQYVDVRHRWLAHHPKPALQATVYRTRCFTRDIARENWDLSQLPITANGVKVFGHERRGTDAHADDRLADLARSATRGPAAPAFFLRPVRGWPDSGVRTSRRGRRLGRAGRFGRKR